MWVCVCVCVLCVCVSSDLSCPGVCLHVMPGCVLACDDLVRSTSDLAGQFVLILTGSRRFEVILPIFHGGV